MSKFTSSLNFSKQILGKKGVGANVLRTGKQNASVATELAYPDDEAAPEHVSNPDHVIRPDPEIHTRKDTIRNSKSKDPAKSFDSLPQTSAVPYIGALWQYKFGKFCLNMRTLKLSLNTNTITFYTMWNVEICHTFQTIYEFRF